jgi:hypothetical protein
MMTSMPEAALTQPSRSFAASRLAASASALMRRHAAGIAVALLLAAMLAGPRWWLLATDPSEGDRVQLSPWGAGTFGYDQSLYTPNIRQAYDGRWTIGGLYAYGDDGAPVQTGAIWMQTIGLLGRATGDIFSSLAIVTTVAAIAAFLLLYAMGVTLTRSRFAAIAAMPIALLCVQAVTQTDTIIGLRHWSVLKPVVLGDPGLDFHAWARFIAPILPLPLFFGAAIAVPFGVETGRRGWIAAAVICMTLLVYTYAFYWTSAGFALAAWLGWLLLKRDVERARRLAIIGSLTALLALPELAGTAWNAFALTHDMRARVGAGTPAPDDIPSWLNIAARFAVGVPFLAGCLRGPERNRLYIALFLAPLILVRAPLGVPQPFHYTLQVWPAFAIPAVLAGGHEIWRVLPERGRPLATTVLAVAALAGSAQYVAVQVRATNNVNDAFAIRSDEHAAFDWIDGHLGRDDVIVTPSITTNIYIASLSRSPKYIRDGFDFIARTQDEGNARPSDDEIVDRYLRTQAAYGFSEDVTFARIDPIYRCKTADDYRCAKPSSNFPFKDVSPVLREREAALEDTMAYYLLNWEITHPETIESRMPAWRERYRELQAQPDPLSAYRADYLYCGPRERLWPAVIDAPSLSVTVAYQQREVTLYRIAAPWDTGGQPFRGC